MHECDNICAIVIVSFHWLFDVKVPVLLRPSEAYCHLRSIVDDPPRVFCHGLCFLRGSLTAAEGDPCLCLSQSTSTSPRRLCWKSSVGGEPHGHTWKHRHPTTMLNSEIAWCLEVSCACEFYSCTAGWVPEWRRETLVRRVSEYRADTIGVEHQGFQVIPRMIAFRQMYDFLAWLYTCIAV